FWLVAIPILIVLTASALCCWAGKYALRSVGRSLSEMNGTSSGTSVSGFCSISREDLHPTLEIIPPIHAGTTNNRAPPINAAAIAIDHHPMARLGDCLRRVALAASLDVIT